MNLLVLRHQTIWTFLLHKSGTTDQTNSNLVSNHKLKSFLLMVVRTKNFASMAAPQRSL